MEKSMLVNVVLAFTDLQHVQSTSFDFCGSTHRICNLERFLRKIFQHVNSTYFDFCGSTHRICILERFSRESVRLTSHNNSSSYVLSRYFQHFY